MKKALLISILFLAMLGKAFSQNINDIGKIVLGVKTTSECSVETKPVETLLVNKLRQLTNNAGYSAYGMNNLFNLVPNVILEDCSIAEGGMKNVYLITGSLFLTIQEETSGIVYSSISYPIKGYGVSKEKAIKDAISKLHFNNLQFLQDAKTKILSYYQEKQDIIFERAKNFVKNKEYDAAITCLLSIPEELSEYYIKALKQANVIYDLRQKEVNTLRLQKRIQHNNVIIQKARGMLATHTPEQAIQVLWNIEPGNPQQDSIVTVLQQQAESQITAVQKEKLRIAEREYNDKKEKEAKELRMIEKEQEHRMNIDNQNMALQKQQESNRYNIETHRIEAIKNVALEYIKNNNNSKSKTK